MLQTGSLGPSRAHLVCLSKALANERRRYICNIFSHLLRPWRDIEKSGPNLRPALYIYKEKQHTTDIYSRHNLIDKIHKAKCTSLGNTHAKSIAPRQCKVYIFATTDHQAPFYAGLGETAVMAISVWYSIVYPEIKLLISQWRLQVTQRPT